MESFNSLYFIGAGGIGMSALIRYYLAKGFKVGGYDRTPSDLTHHLIEEKADIHFMDDIRQVADCYKDPKQTLIVRTPAVPESHGELTWFREHNFKIVKRAELLGMITRTSKGLCIAGTHGKTTTSSMTAHLLKQSHVDCNAFLGGILKNYHSNLMLSDQSDFTVIEADEYDRSFHQLRPYMAAITSADPDHLDIYGNEANYLESFAHFTSLIQPGGALVMHTGVKVKPRLQESVRFYTYSGTETGDFHAQNIRIGNGTIIYDFVHPEGVVTDIELGVPVRINIDNSVAALALGWLNGVTADEMRHAMATFGGAERRFDFKIKTDDLVMIDDYAHHPDEIKASISSVRALYPNKKITVVFQPHLYTRTRDFAPDFAKSLSLADEVILLDIYPAREEPIPGITSEVIFKQLNVNNKLICKKDSLLQLIKERKFEVIMMMGAGDIDRLVEPVKEILSK